MYRASLIEPKLVQIGNVRFGLLFDPSPLLVIWRHGSNPEPQARTISLAHTAKQEIGGQLSATNARVGFVVSKSSELNLVGRSTEWDWWQNNSSSIYAVAMKVENRSKIEAVHGDGEVRQKRRSRRRIRRVYGYRYRYTDMWHRSIARESLFFCRRERRGSDRERERERTTAPATASTQPNTKGEFWFYAVIWN